MLVDEPEEEEELQSSLDEVVELEEELLCFFVKKTMVT